MSAIIEILMAIIFTVVVGSGAVGVISKVIKKEAIIKVSGGLGSLELFTRKLTNKN